MAAARVHCIDRRALHTRLNPSSSATRSRSRGKGTPKPAAAPRGQRSRRHHSHRRLPTPRSDPRRHAAPTGPSWTASPGADGYSQAAAPLVGAGRRWEGSSRPARAPEQPAPAAASAATGAAPATPDRCAKSPRWMRLPASPTRAISACSSAVWPSSCAAEMLSSRRSVTGFRSASAAISALLSDADSRPDLSQHARMRGRALHVEKAAKPNRVAGLR